MLYRGSVIERLCQTHGRVLADGGYRGVDELITPIVCRRRILRNNAWRRHRRRRARVERANPRLKDGESFEITDAVESGSGSHCKR